MPDIRFLHKCPELCAWYVFPVCRPGMCLCCVPGVVGMESCALFVFPACLPGVILPGCWPGLCASSVCLTLCVNVLCLVFCAPQSMLCIVFWHVCLVCVTSICSCCVYLGYVSGVECWRCIMKVCVSFCPWCVYQCVCPDCLAIIAGLTLWAQSCVPSTICWVVHVRHVCLLLFA